MKYLNILGNALFISNVVVGILQIHWAIIALFAVLHMVARHLYIQAELKAAQGQDEELNKIQAAMPAVRHAATVVSSIVVAAILYGLGYGARALVNAIM
ncbi:hypothetical protein [Alysiella filiformis]|uniref:Uncharacterized protein n=1 Tax=Alysiella filiformis DSM 16848 TaxID=1120981 RepID=A0A286EDD4_9NEIS|nr:hypothetical protein [Alysiella filiformis]QMT31165.1 hypothetical protein H3L97_10710 [Alysiella filiformis]UBQ55841.1 hypothetical protein JF568_09760 [Alysiella filiformis DSM 16848]SOD68854.1 hypothetical protein SAMN02746062_01418 [Alysiella filiformis DSM 16848]